MDYRKMKLSSNYNPKMAEISYQKKTKAKVHTLNPS